MCRYNKASTDRLEHQQHHQTVFGQISQLHLLKTCKIDDFVATASQRLREYKKFSKYYNSDNW